MLLRHLINTFKNRLNTREKFPKSEFRNDTKFIRDANWKAAETPIPLRCRHVELTAPGNDTKMVINAMNSKADGYMFDLEDSMSPTRCNVSSAHENLLQLVNGTICHIDDKKTYTLNATTTPTLHVRVRGLHLEQDGGSAFLYDVAEFMEHCAWPLLESGRGPYLYIPKLESYEDSLFVNDVLSQCEHYLAMPHGSTKTTVLIETFPSIFQTNEILYAQKERITALNCGRWDYLFSMIKCNPDVLFPEREQMSMEKVFLKDYVGEIVRTCHRRNIHAMGGMSAFIPSAGADITNTVRRDKELEIQLGCDGAWVAHPAMIEQVQSLFRSAFNGAPHQKHRCGVPPKTPRTFLSETGAQTARSLEQSVHASLFYLHAWLQGHGAVAYAGKMEDLATFEIAAHQLKNWIQHNVVLDTGIPTSTSLVFDLIDKHNFEAKPTALLKKYLSGHYSFLSEAAESC